MKMFEGSPSEVKRRMWRRKRLSKIVLIGISTAAGISLICIGIYRLTKYVNNYNWTRSDVYVFNENASNFSHCCDKFDKDYSAKNVDAIQQDFANMQNYIAWMDQSARDYNQGNDKYNGYDEASGNDMTRLVDDGNAFMNVFNNELRNAEKGNYSQSKTDETATTNNWNTDMDAYNAL